MKFSFDVRGYLYHNGLSDIRTAYERTMEAMDKLCEEADQRKANISKLIQSGEMENHTYDDDGVSHPTALEIAEFLIEEAESTANIARSAYVLIFYHYWEKNCAHWMGKTEKYDAKKAYHYLAGDNVPFSEVELERMRKLANFIKHDKSECRADHPEFFQPPPRTHPGSRVIHSDDLWLTSHHMDDLFETLRTSGYPAP